MMYQAIRLALGFLEPPGTQAQIACRVRLGRCSRDAAREFPPLGALADVLELREVDDAVRCQLDLEEEIEQEDIAMGLERLWDQHTGTGDSD